MLVFSKKKSSPHTGGDRPVIVCSEDDSVFYSTENMAVVYSKGPTGCSMLKHGPSQHIRDYFRTTCSIMEQLAPGIDTSIGFVQVSDTCSMDDLTHAINTSAVSEELFKKLNQ